MVCAVIIFFYKRLVSLGYFGVFLAGFVGSATLTLPTPVSPVIGAAGAMLDPWLVGLFASIGAAVGDINGYFIGQVGDSFVASDFAKLQAFMKDYGFFTLFALSALPGHDITGLVAGYNKYPITLFLLATFLGKLLKFLGFAHVGKSLAKVSKRKA